MKQKKYGQKIQNWHRPLGPSQLRQQFLRKRYDDPELKKQGRSIDCSSSGDFDWDWDYGDEDWDEPENSWRFGLFNYYLDQVLDPITNPPSPLICLKQLTDVLANRHPKADLPEVDPDPKSLLPVEERLSAYLDRLAHFPANLTFIQSCIHESIGDSLNLDIVKSWGDNLQYPHLAKYICLFAPFWIRSPQTWSENGERSLIDHLFVLYDVPDFLYYQWFYEPEVPRFKWWCWFILLGQGGSLKRAAERFQWNIPNRFQHYLQHVTFEASPTDACLFVEVKRLGGSAIDFIRLRRNPAFVIDPTEYSAVNPYMTFWYDTVRWLIIHSNAITDTESDLILAWAMHEYTEAERAENPPFSWKGRRVRRVLERSRQYGQQLRRSASGDQWQSHGWDWGWNEVPSERWSFVELTSGEALFDESQAMHHCVSNYARQCAAGRSAIVSMRYNDTRCLTIEIDLETRQVVQVNGLCNRSATTKEQRVVARWMERVLPEPFN